MEFLMALVSKTESNTQLGPSSCGTAVDSHAGQRERERERERETESSCGISWPVYAQVWSSFSIDSFTTCTV